jgi:uncharacterized protein YbjT (DUF2867 family)
VGAPLVRQLLAAGATVRAASHEAPGVAYSSSLSTVRLDLAEPSTWPRALSNVRRLFLAIPAGDDGACNVRPFLEAVASTGVDHVAFLSWAGVQQGTPHWQVEADIDAIGLARTFLRPAMLHQQLADSCGGQIVDHDRLRLPLGVDDRVAYVDARDVARVAAMTLVSPSPAPRTTYTLTGQHALSGAEVAALWSRVLGRRITFEPVPPARSLLPVTASAQLSKRGTIDPSLQQLLKEPPTSLSDYITQHRSRWATPVG